MLKRLLLLSFIEGAAVMAAELCGAKLLAPIFGSSLYVWASVMGITLAALALGYFAGGWLSHKKNSLQTSLFQILTVAALFVIAMPVLSYYAVPRISYLPFLPGVVLSTILLLFLPVFFLGASSPLFIHLQTKSEHSAGKVSGTVYAVSTAGGIFATFFCGFYLIPVFGLSSCLFLFGGALLLAGFIVLKMIRFPQIFVLAVLAYLNFQFISKSTGALAVSDGLMGHLEVKEILNEKKEVVRLLQINSITQTEMNVNTQRSVSEYMRLLDTIIPVSNHSKSSLVLGLGGGLSANLLVRKNYSCDGVELDGRIIKAANDYFFLDKKIRTFETDARYFLNACESTYDVVLADVFKAEEQPSHILTLESLNHLKRNLKDSALLIINWHGYVSGKKGLGTRILLNTLKQAGYQVKLCSASANENYRNLIVIASLSLLGTLPYELHESTETCTLINTDNYPLMERYNAEANKSWRSSYLRFYQSRN